MPQTRGTVFVTLRAFIGDRYGEREREMFIQALPPEDRAVFEVATSTGWYDFQGRLRALHALDRVLGAGDGLLVRDFGRFGAERDLSTVQRMFLRLANPAYVLEKSTDYWSRFYDFGRWEVARRPGGARAVLRDNPTPDPLFCHELGGYIHRMFELVGARQVTLAHSYCVGRGDAECCFEGGWK